MRTVGEAQSIVLQHARRRPAATLPLTSAALDLVLAEDVASDLDMPPHDKALMDGFAVRSADLPEGKGVLAVVEEVMAGGVPTRALGPGQATAVMTGAPLPAGADAVVIVERTQRLDSGRVVLDDRPPQPGQNVLPLGREMRRGETVLTAGTVLRPVEFGLLATVGRTAVSVFPAPRVAVLSTGDEVVEAGQKPGPGQIRNGNGPMLCALVSQAGGLPRYLGIARDNLDSLRPLVAEGLAAEVLVLSGGVSAGQRDLVPAVLEEAGVEAHLHKVAMKPGKPVLFGTRGDTLVFGLPGNPVSALVCFHLFVKPALRALAGHAEPGPRLVEAVLTEELAHRSDRPTYFPARLAETPTGWQVRAVPWFGSADLRGLLPANAFLVLPAGEHRFSPGQVLPVLSQED